MDHAAQLQAWRDYVDGSSSDHSDQERGGAQAAPWPPRRADPASPANPPRLDRSPASLSDSGDLETWLESIGVPSAGPPPAHEGLYAQIEQRGYSRDEIDSLQEQFERFAGFRFDRAPALISALEARRKVFAQAEDELRRRQTQEAKKRKAAARVVVEKRNIVEERLRAAQLAAEQRGRLQILRQRAIEQRRAELELRGRKIRAVLESLQAVRYERLDIDEAVAKSTQRTAQAVAYSSDVSLSRHALLGSASPPTLTVPFTEWQNPDESDGWLYLTKEGGGEEEEETLEAGGLWLRDGTYLGWKRWCHESGGLWLRRRVGMDDWRIVDRRTDECEFGYPAQITTHFVCKPADGCIVDTEDPTNRNHNWLQFLPCFRSVLHEDMRFSPELPPEVAAELAVRVPAVETELGEELGEGEEEEEEEEGEEEEEEKEDDQQRRSMWL